VRSGDPAGTPTIHVAREALLEHTTDEERNATGADLRHVDPLPNLTTMSLRAILESEDTALAHAVRQVLADIDKRNKVISAFQSYAT
jgi:FXSXX-COOH protein